MQKLNVLFPLFIFSSLRFFVESELEIIFDSEKGSTK